MIVRRISSIVIAASCQARTLCCGLRLVDSHRRDLPGILDEDGWTAPARTITGTIGSQRTNSTNLFMLRSSGP